MGVPILVQLLTSVEKAGVAIETNVAIAEKSTAKEDKQKMHAHVLNQLLPGFHSTARGPRVLQQPIALDQEIGNPTLAQIHRLLIEISVAIPNNLSVMLESLDLRLGQT